MTFLELRWSCCDLTCWIRSQRRRTDGQTDRGVFLGYFCVKCHPRRTGSGDNSLLPCRWSSNTIGDFCTVQSGLWGLCGVSVGSLWGLCGVSVGSLWDLCGVTVGQPASHQRPIQNQKDLQDLFSMFLILYGNWRLFYCLLFGNPAHSQML